MEKGDIVSNDAFETIINDFNKMFKMNINHQDFNLYRRTLIRKFQDRELDIVLVVNMLTTGFDSKILNTLYVDKSLEKHGLVQTFSRTNRIEKEIKKHGHIVAMHRPSKEKVDGAIELYSSNSADSCLVLKESYKSYVDEFNRQINQIKEQFPNVDSVYSLKTEDEEKQFVLAFREAIQTLNILRSFIEFEFDDLNCKEQEIINYSGAYKKLYRDNLEQKDKFSILDEIDFAIESVHTDLINASYIHDLLGNLTQGGDVSSFKDAINNIYEQLDQSIYPQKLIDLIKQFIKSKLPVNMDELFVPSEINYDELVSYIEKTRENDLAKIIDEYQLNNLDFYKWLNDYQIKGKFDFGDLNLIYEKVPSWEVLQPLYDKITSGVLEVYKYTNFN
ncbi:MAG: hypothetical protein GQ557_00800 [Mycoplasmataceae bacterium]|nr:hypothetical protein [Mycoplasmataceae bacterium]